MAKKMVGGGVIHVMVTEMIVQPIRVRHSVDATHSSSEDSKFTREQPQHCSKVILVRAPGKDSEFDSETGRKIFSNARNPPSRTIARMVPSPSPVRAGM